MPDPNGFVQNQKRGDIAVYDGAQWRTSSSYGSDSYGTVGPRVAQYLDGSSGAPTVMARPTVKISRTELLTTSPNVLDPQYNAALEVLLSSQTNNAVQPTAVYAVSTGYAATGNYLLPFYARADHTGGSAGAAAGMYVGTSTNVTGGAVFGIAFNVNNLTNANMTSAGGKMAILDLAAGSSPAKLNGSAIQIRTTGGNGFDSAIYFTGASVIGLDLSQGTYSTAEIKGTSLTVLGSTLAMVGAGAIFKLGTTTTAVVEMDYNAGNGGILFQTITTHYPFIFYNGNFCLYMDSSTIWTPTANQTAVHLYEGVTPTKRRVQWKDGATLVAGDKVMVLV